MKAYVITILDEPRSVSVSNRCIASGKKFGIDIEIFKAFTPHDDIMRRFKAEKLPYDKFFDRWSRGKNAMSCFFSHYNLWKRCIELNEPILIFEHDAVIKDQLPSVPFKGLLSYGAPSYGKFITPRILGVNKLVSKQYLPGAHAYALKPEAAERMMTLAKRFAQPTDVYLHNSRFDFLEEYYPWPVEVEENFSTVQAISGCNAKHAYKKAPDLFELVYLHGS